jgi:hypothetical protein
VPSNAKQYATSYTTSWDAASGGRAAALAGSATLDADQALAALTFRWSDHRDSSK